MEVLDVIDALILLRDRRSDGESDLFVRELDGQLELLRRVHRVELECPFRLAEGCREIAQIRQGEAHVVVSFGEIGIRLDRTCERIARVGVFLELDEDQTDAVPRHRMRSEEYTSELQSRREIVCLPL